jgi:hypothetical protein
MSVSWYVDFPCPVRARFSSEQMGHMEVSRNRANLVLEVMRKGPQASSGVPEDDWTFTVNDQSGAKTVRIGDLLSHSKPLDDLRHFCVSCIANLRDTSFGCGSGIRYPISAAAEHWLISLVPSDISSPRGTLFAQALDDFAADVSDIDSTRQSGIFFESTAPSTWTWNKGAKRPTGSSSQIVKLLLFVGTLDSNHARLMAFFLGYLDESFNPTDHEIDTNADQSIIELHTFLRGCASASQNNTSLYIDA